MIKIFYAEFLFIGETWHLAYVFPCLANSRLHLLFQDIIPNRLKQRFKSISPRRNSVWQAAGGLLSRAEGHNEIRKWQRNITVGPGKNQKAGSAAFVS